MRDFRVTLREQVASTCQGYDNDRGGDLPTALDSFSFHAGIEPGLFGGGLGELDPDRVSLVDDEQDSVFGCKLGSSSSGQHHGHGVAVGVKQVEALLDAGRLGGHWRKVRATLRAVDWR